MALFGGTWISVGAGGVRTAEVTINDSNTDLSSSDAGTVWRVDGVALPAPPVVESGFVQLAFRDGTVGTFGLARVQLPDRTLYLAPTSVMPEAVTGAAGFAPLGTVGSFAYLNRNMVPLSGRMYAGDTVVEEFSTDTGALNRTGADAIVIIDDDKRLQSHGTAAPRTEAGRMPSA